MSQQIYYNASEDKTYSFWHRAASIERFLGKEKAKHLGMINLDVVLYVEYNEHTQEPCAIFEIARDTGQSTKTATVTKNLAILANLPAATVLYTVSKTQALKQQHKMPSGIMDIEFIRYQRLFPNPCKDWQTVTPKQWAHILWNMRNMGKVMQNQQFWDSGVFRNGCA